MWTAEQWREGRKRRRRERGLPERADPFESRAAVARGRELAAMLALPILDWPQDLFSAAPSQMATQKLAAGDICACGCGKAHRHNVSQTVRAPVGTGWHVIYFWSEACKSKLAREKANGK